MVTQLIRLAQLAAMRQHGSGAFATRMMAHLRQHFPEELASLKDGHLLAAVEEAIQRGHRHGLTSARDLCRFLNLCAVFGWSFDDDQRLRLVWNDPATADAAVRLERVYARCLRRLEVWQLNENGAAPETPL